MNTKQLTKASANPNMIGIPSLQDIDKLADKPLAVSSQTMIASIIEAAGFGKKALQLELATGIALFMETNGATRESKQAFQKIYVAAGYDAEDQFKPEYKTVRRRIDAAAELYNWFGHEPIAGWVGTSKEKKFIANIVRQLEQYDLRGINSVFALVGKPISVKRPAPAQTTENVGGSDNSGEMPADAQAVANAVGADIRQEREKRGRRSSDVPGMLNFSTDNIKVVIAPTATRSELISVSMQILEFIETLEVSEESTTENKSTQKELATTH